MKFRTGTSLPQIAALITLKLELDMTVIPLQTQNEVSMSKGSIYDLETYTDRQTFVKHLRTPSSGL